MTCLTTFRLRGIIYIVHAFSKSIADVRVRYFPKEVNWSMLVGNNFVAFNEEEFSLCVGLLHIGPNTRSKRRIFKITKNTRVPCTPGECYLSLSSLSIKCFRPGPMIVNLISDLIPTFAIFVALFFTRALLCSKECTHSRCIFVITIPRKYSSL